MQEERKSRVQSQQQKKQQQSKLLVLVLIVVMIGACAVLFLHGAGESETPEDVAPPEEIVDTDTTSDTNVTEPEVIIPAVSEEDSWKTVLVNNSHALADGYVPELVTVDNTNFKFDARAAEDLNAMLQDARAEGLAP